MLRPGHCPGLRSGPVRLDPSSPSLGGALLQSTAMAAAAERRSSVLSPLHSCGEDLQLDLVAVETEVEVSSVRQGGSSLACLVSSSVSLYLYAI